MSDSDTDLFLDNVYAYQNQSTKVTARGPNINTTSLSIQNNNMLTSTKNMHWNMERPRYATSVYDERSMYSRRETSPMSFRSASGVHLRNLHHSYYPGGMSSQRSMYNGRSGSPMSVRTIDSNTSATDIALALKTGHFNRSDMQIIKEAFNKCIKRSVRKRIEKRRNLRTFLKGCRRKSGGDSGDQASDSSLSSDDHISVRSSRTATFNGNANCRTSKINFMDLRKTMKESGMYRDSTDDLRQNRFPNMLSIPPGSSQDDLQHRLNNTSLMSKSSRFRHRFLLPSQRFNANQTVASLPIPEMPSVGQERMNDQIKNSIQNGYQSDFKQNRDHARENAQEAISEQEEIFSEITMMQTSNETRFQCKRGLEEDDITPYSRKKNKLSTPVKKIVKPSTLKPRQIPNKSNNNDNGKDFVFAKPQLPAKKPVIVKNVNVKSQQVSVGKFKSLKTCSTIPSKTQTSQIVSNPQQLETLISKSQSEEETVQATLNTNKAVYQSPEKIISKSSQPLDLPQQRTLNLPQNNCEKDEHEMTYSTTDMSMRPSFIKRKLFTQKIDEAENSVISEDSHTESTQSDIYSKIQKEKNKARKLATQSCLSRDVGDKSNLLCLIHKYVPPDLMNLTTATNKSEIQIRKSNPVNSDTWDITELISTNKSEELSDTYTDDEIFLNHEAQQNHANNKQNYGKENKIQVATDKSTTLKTVDNQCKPLNTKNVINNNINKVLQKNSEKAETNKKDDKIDANNLTKKSPKTLSSPKVILQKLSPHIWRQMENVKNLQPNDMSASHLPTNDFNTRLHCSKQFWNEIDSANSATPLKNSELKGKVLTNSPSMNHSVSNQRNNTQNEIRQIVNSKNVMATNLIAQTATLKNSKDDTSKKGNQVKSKEKIAEKLEVNQNVKVQPNRERALYDVSKCMNSNIETSKETYAKPTSTDTKANTKSKVEKIPTINNNTLQIRSQRIPKNNKTCTDDNLNATVNTSNESQLCRTLRSRVINLSTSLDKEPKPLNKKTSQKTKQKPVKNKHVTNLNDKENISKTSDQSFTLSSKTPVTSKLAAVKRVNTEKSVKLNVTKSRESDVSFTLGEKELNHRTTNSRRRKEIEKLQLGAPKYFNSVKISPLGKRVVSTRLNKSRSSARLKSKVY